MQNIEQLIEKYTLANAYLHEGKAQLGAVIGKLIGDDSSLKTKLKELTPKINKIISEVNKLPLEKQKQKLESIYPEFFEKKEIKARELPDMPNAEKGKVVMRLAPYPSGALHLGNAKTYMLNALYADKYEGKLLFVMDDTIGSAKKYITPEAYDLMPEGFKWLGVKWHGKIIYKSDRLEKYYEFAEDLIKRDLAYVCECAIDVLRDNRANAKDCSCRANSIDTNLKKWKDMLAKKYKEGKVALRLKTSMQHPNPAFRDRVLAKIVERSHPLVKNKYVVWPTLELSWAYDDHYLGSTHIFRGNDLVIESDTCRFIWEKLGWNIPVMLHTGLIQLKGIKLSKSKALQEVTSGKYTGWDDPRTNSLQSLRRRGILPEAVVEFIKEIGPNKTDIEVPIDNLYMINRRMIDQIANRYYFVDSPVEISFSKDFKQREVDIKLHPDKEATRKLQVKQTIYVSKNDFTKLKGKEVRLMHLFNRILNKKTDVTSEENKDIPKIQWVSDYVLAEIIMPDGKITKGYAESNVSKLKIGDIIQFERFGFCKLDKKEKDKLTFCFAHK